MLKYNFDSDLPESDPVLISSDWPLTMYFMFFKSMCWDAQFYPKNVLTLKFISKLEIASFFLFFKLS